jgi:hypothetical protein
LRSVRDCAGHCSAAVSAAFPRWKDAAPTRAGALLPRHWFLGKPSTGFPRLRSGHASSAHSQARAPFPSTLREPQGTASSGRGGMTLGSRIGRRCRRVFGFPKRHGRFLICALASSCSVRNGAFVPGETLVEKSFVGTPAGLPVLPEDTGRSACATERQRQECLCYRTTQTGLSVLPNDKDRIVCATE